MKKIVKTLASLAFIGTFAVSLHAVDFGGLLKNDTKFTTPTFQYVGLNQVDSLVGWIKLPITKNGKIYFSAEADATFMYTTPNLSANMGTASFLANLSLCKVTMYNNVWNGILQLNLGRFSNSDSTGRAISQTLDGAQVTFSSNYVKAIVSAGYTGLTNARYDSIIESGTTTFKADPNAVYQPNSPYIVTGISTALPYLFANQTIGFEGYATFGVGGISGSNIGTNRFYATAMANGPIIQSLYYAFSTTFGITGEGKVGNLSKFSITYYPPALNSSVSAEVLYASGNNGFLSPFTGFTRQTAYLAGNGDTEYSGIIKIGATGTIRPLEMLFINLGADVVLSCMDSFDYTGFQWHSQLDFQPFTDLKIGLSAQQFIGKDSTRNNMAFGLNVVFAF